jgi:carbamoyltransferase
MLIYIIQRFEIDSVILVGGCFLNVKANYRILDEISGRMTVMPLSGDQGVALGLYKLHNPEFEMPSSLCWGHRNLTRFNAPRTEFFNAMSVMSSRLDELLESDKIVNIVWGKMEFGPRALCHTSTIAKPHADNVNYINSINGRSTIMPMGPVCSDGLARKIFYNIERCVKSHEYMISAFEYDQVHYAWKGVSHELPLGHGLTGRPQTIHRDHPSMDMMGKSLDNFGILINTSFNIHGVPICCTTEQIKECVKRYRS